MGASGAWRAKAAGVEPYTGALKWGNGSDPVHSMRGGIGRNTAPDGGAGVGGTDMDELQADDYGFTYEDSAPVFIWQPPAEEGQETGIDDRPEWGTDTQDTRAAVTKKWPSWGRHKSRTTGGSIIRAEEHGGIASATPNAVPTSNGAEGWRNKISAPEEYKAETSDPSQYEMQTSMTQRNKVRAGSQRGASSPSPYSAPIKSRVAGPKLKFYGDHARHEAMTPKAQDIIIRPFWLRTGGTGRVSEMGPNAMRTVGAQQRNPPLDPYVPDDDSNSSGDAYGYVSEDQTW